MIQSSGAERQDARLCPTVDAVNDVAVIGLGYVGLPLVREACRSGMRVLGFDVSQSVIEGLSRGFSHVDDVGTADVAAMLASGLTVSSDPETLASAQTIVICVPTPLDTDGRPDLSAVTAAGRMVGPRLRTGVLVVLESTTYPGTTDEVLRPLLEEGSGLRAGTDFSLAFSPERIWPGNGQYGVKNTPKVVGGYTPGCTRAAEAFYASMVDEVVTARGTREAEMAKLLENTYRHVNIALVNEMAVFCNELDIDLWDAIACAGTKPFGFQSFYPGPGVGGHCIPIDPNYLSYRVRRLGYPFRFVELAQEINERMPGYVVHRVQDLLNERRLPVADAEVLLLGVTYKPDITDIRESPAEPVVRGLRRLHAKVSFHDPHVDELVVDGEPVPRVEELATALSSADISVLLQDHTSYLDGGLTAAKLLFDTRGRHKRGKDIEVL